MHGHSTVSYGKTVKRVFCHLGVSCTKICEKKSSAAGLVGCVFLIFPSRDLLTDKSLPFIRVGTLCQEMLLKVYSENGTYSGLLTLCCNTCAIIRDNGQYAVVDSHARNACGMVYGEGKCSCIFFFNGRCIPGHFPFSLKGLVIS